jgi:predicted secreted protein
VKEKKMLRKGIKITSAGIVTTLLVVLIVTVSLPAASAETGDVIINEIMYNPPGADAELEWIELLSTNATEAVNITGWMIDTNPLPESVIPPMGFVVLARNKTAFEAYYGAVPCAVIDVTFVLNNDPGDTIVLKDVTGAEIDNVTYNASWGADGNGKTLERTPTGWAESRVDNGTPCRRNSVIVPFAPVVLPMIYMYNITVDAMSPTNVGQTATVSIFTATEVIDNETHYVVIMSKPDSIAKMYLGVDDVNQDYVLKRTVITMATGEEIANLTFDPAFVSRDFPLWIGKTWSDTANVSGMFVNQTGAVISVDSAASVVGGVTEDIVTVPLGTFPCMVLENNVSYEVNGERVSNVRKYWETQMNNEIICPKYQMWRNGILMEEFEAFAFVPPVRLTAADNGTTINVTTGQFLVITLEANPGSTGFGWEVVEPSDEQVLRQYNLVRDIIASFVVVEPSDEQVLRQLGDITYVPPEVVLPGAPGVQIATFEVVGAGKATITMVYRRPWEGDVPPADTFTVDVIAS